MQTEEYTVGRNPPAEPSCSLALSRELLVSLFVFFSSFVLCFYNISSSYIRPFLLFVKSLSSLYLARFRIFKTLAIPLRPNHKSTSSFYFEVFFFVRSEFQLRYSRVVADSVVALLFIFFLYPIIVGVTETHEVYSTREKIITSNRAVQVSLLGLHGLRLLGQ